MLSAEGLTLTTSCSICRCVGVPSSVAGVMGPPSASMSSGVIWVTGFPACLAIVLRRPALPLAGRTDGVGRCFSSVLFWKVCCKGRTAMGKGVAEGIQARHIGVCPRFFPFFPLDGTPEMETPANVNLQGFRSISRRVGDSNPRYSNPVRQFSKLVVSATHPTLRAAKTKYCYR